MDNQFVLDVTKSSLMLFSLCPYKYKRIYVDKTETFDASLLLNGSVYHKIRADFFKSIDITKVTKDFNENFAYFRSLLPSGKDIVYDNLANVEAVRACYTSNQYFLPVEIEKKYKTVFYDLAYYIQYDGYANSDIQNILDYKHLVILQEQYGVFPILKVTGKIDDLYYEHSSYRIKEFKTGSFNSGSSSKIRKELILYSLILEPHLDRPIKYISYHFAYENNYKLEEIQKRSVTALKNLMFKLIISTLDNQFESKYYKVTCDKNCQFCNECKLRTIFGR